MRLWLRNRRVLLLVVVLAAVLAAGTVLGTRSVVLPVVFGTGPGGTLLTTFLPLCWAAAIAEGFAARTSAVEARPARHLALLDVSLFLGLAAVAAATFAQVVVVTGPVLAGAGSVLIVSAVSCAVTLAQGAAHGVFAASLLVLLTTLYAADAPGSGLVRVLQPDGNAGWSLAWGVVLCAVAGRRLLRGTG